MNVILFPKAIFQEFEQRHHPTVASLFTLPFLSPGTGATGGGNNIGKAGRNKFKKQEKVSKLNSVEAHGVSSVERSKEAKFFNRFHTDSKAKVRRKATALARC